MCTRLTHYSTRTELRLILISLFFFFFPFFSFSPPSHIILQASSMGMVGEGGICSLTLALAFSSHGSKVLYWCAK